MLQKVGSFLAQYWDIILFAAAIVVLAVFPRESWYNVAGGIGILVSLSVIVLRRYEELRGDA